VKDVRIITVLGIKLSDVEYDLLNSRKDLHWYCGKCENKVLKSIHLDKEIEQKLENFWAKVEDRLAQFNHDVDSVTQSTNAKIQSLEVILTEMRTDMNKNKHEAYGQEMKAVQAKVDALNKELERVNARFGEIDVSLQKTVEKQQINFRDIMKDQLEQEM